MEGLRENVASNRKGHLPARAIAVGTRRDALAVTSEAAPSCEQEVSAIKRSIFGSLAVVLALLMGVACSSGSGFVGAWEDAEGRKLPDGVPGGEPLVLHVLAGAEHCGWQSAVFLYVAWPIGKPTETAAHIRQYIRDPKGVVAPELAKEFDADAILPEDARSTGFHREEWELWVSPSQGERYVYLVNDDDVERWPSSTLVPAEQRVGRLLLCA